MPSPTKNRTKSAIGFQAAAAAGDTDRASDAAAPIVATASGSAGPPPATAAAGRTTAERPSESRRPIAAAPHNNAAALGEPESPPPSHDNQALASDDAVARTGADTADTSKTGTGAAASTTTTAAGNATGAATFRPDTDTDTGAADAGATPAAAPVRVEPAPEDCEASLRTELFGCRGPRPPRTAVPPTSPSDTSLGSTPLPTERSAAPPRIERCRDAPTFDDVVAESGDTLDPVEPLEPDVSATATGNDTTAAPTPSATANAPTRPTAPPARRGWEDIRRPTSIARTEARSWQPSANTVNPSGSRNMATPSARNDNLSLSVEGWGAEIPISWDSVAWRLQGINVRSPNRTSWRQEPRATANDRNQLRTSRASSPWPNSSANQHSGRCRSCRLTAPRWRCHRRWMSPPPRSMAFRPHRRYRRCPRFRRCPPHFLPRRWFPGCRWLQTSR